VASAVEFCTFPNPGFGQPILNLSRGVLSVADPLPSLTPRMAVRPPTEWILETSWTPNN